MLWCELGVAVASSWKIREQRRSRKIKAETHLTADRDRTHPGRGNTLLAAVELVGPGCFALCVVSVLQQLVDLRLDVSRVLGEPS